MWVVRRVGRGFALWYSGSLYSDGFGDADWFRISLLYNMVRSVMHMGYKDDRTHHKI